ncbi:type VII secretion-associated serine protease mycosin [Mycolicibacterium moriokaense]|nr:type VII secretion-associated serine protease mycosin [Mycolicibacterium moriokaense]
MRRLTRGARTSSAAAAAVLLLGANVLLPAAATAIQPPGIDPAALPPDDTPGPDQEMKQQNTCADPLTVATPDVSQPAPGNVMLDITQAWKYSTGAGVTVGLIDTGVTPNPRFPELFAGGDYVMGDANGGLFDCDSHGTVVASIIAAQPSDPAAKPPPMPPNAGPPPAPPNVEASPFPTTPPPPPPKPSTVTVTAPPPPPPPGDAPPPDEPVAPAAGPGGGEQPPVPGPPPGSPDGVVGVAPDAALISVRQSSSAFGPARPQPGDNEEIRRKAGDIATLARAVVHLANLGVRVMNISVTACINAAQPIDQAALGAAIHYAAVDKDIVIVAAAGNEGEGSACGQNPMFNPLRPDDPRDWQDVSTIVTPAWYSDYVLTVGAVSPDGQPLPQSIAGPWVGVAAPGLEVMGLSSVNGAPINALPGRDPGKAIPLSGTSFATAYTSGVAALVRAKYPQLSSHQIIRRITETAHNPPRGVDNKVGYGVVDPVAALTFDVPPGDRLPPEHLTDLLHVPAPPPPPDLRPRHTALIGAAVVGVLAVAVAGVAAVRRRRS